MSRFTKVQTFTLKPEAAFALQTRSGFRVNSIERDMLLAGQELLRVAQASHDQFAQLSGRLTGQSQQITGELVVTAVPGMSHRLTPILTRFQAAHPGLIVRLLIAERLFRLEYGEAHVAIRAGSSPEHQDNVVQPLIRQGAALYATPDHVKTCGKPASEAEFARRWFVGFVDPSVRAPFFRWMHDHVSPDQSGFRSSDLTVLRDAVRSSAGIGFLFTGDDACRDLIEIAPPRDAWSVPL